MFYNREEVYLPFSGNRYKLNKFGEILFNDNIVEYKVINGKKFVKISWIFGLTYYEVGTIIAIVFYEIKLPTDLWKKIEPIYEDGDGLNTNLVNISYRFKNGPIEVSEYPGFYYIPYYTKYAINKNGEVITLDNGKIKNWLITKYKPKKNIKGGYRSCRGAGDTNQSYMSRHRVIGLTFIYYKKNPLKLVINHKDGIPGNDDPSNLEWVTRAENNQHAYDNNLLPNKVVKILMKDLNNNTITKFNTIAECCRKIDVSDGFIRSRMSKNNIRYSDGLVFKLDDESEWPILSDIIRTATVTREVLARNVFTGEIFLFANTVKAGEFTNTYQKNVYFHTVHEANRPINGFNFRFNSENVNWPIHNSKQLEKYKLLLKL